jgi:hypothetical protein
MPYAFIYDLNGNVLKTDFRFGITSDEVLAEARNVARADRRSAVVENWPAGEVYRVTPAGHVWRPPKGWKPSWDMFDERRADALRVELNRLALRRQRVRDNDKLTPGWRRRMLEKIAAEQRRIEAELATL